MSATTPSIPAPQTAFADWVLRLTLMVGGPNSGGWL